MHAGCMDSANAKHKSLDLSVFLDDSLFFSSCEEGAGRTLDLT